MPAWITSLLREDVSVPIPSAASRMITSRPVIASARATASPTTPAPTTTQSTSSTPNPSSPMPRRRVRLRRKRSPDMRIAVIGAGGVGGAFGAALAKAGGDVTFVARGGHLAAMRERGLLIESERGETLIQPVQATGNPSSVGPVDIVLFCVKLWDVESAGEEIKPLIGPDTGVIPLQNGIDASDRLLPILGARHVMAGTVSISATIARPGVIRQTGTFMALTFGERDGQSSPRAEAFRALCQSASFDVELSGDIAVPIWTKFVLLTAMSGGTAITR